MRRNRSAARELIAALVSALVAFASAMTLIGHPARLVHVLTIFAGGLGSGVAIAAARARRREEQQERR